MSARRLIVLGALVAACVVAWTFRADLFALVVTFALGRALMHRAGIRGRRRPKASWAKNGEALALLIAAWSTRGLVRPKTLARKTAGFDAAPRREPRRRYVGSGPGDEVPY